MDIREARRLVELAISKAWDGFDSETDEITIYAWSDPPSVMKRHPLVGFRVAEVSCARTRPDSIGGSSYMQGDTPHGIAVCAAAERAVIALVEDWPIEEQHSEFWRLAELISEDDDTAKRVADEIFSDDGRSDLVRDALLITWDWREQIPVDEVSAAAQRGFTHMHVVDDTGGDFYAIVASKTELDPDDVEPFFGQLMKADGWVRT